MGDGLSKGCCSSGCKGKTGCEYEMMDDGPSCGHPDGEASAPDSVELSKTAKFLETKVNNSLEEAAFDQAASLANGACDDRWNEGEGSTDVIAAQISTPRCEGDPTISKEAETLDHDVDRSCGGVASGLTAAKQEYVSYDDGSSYMGQMVAGNRHGKGAWQCLSGDYEGQWMDDTQHGHGRQTWSDGRLYEGQFDRGHFAGQGRMVWVTKKGELIYEGQYEKDLKHGSGKFVWADGRMFDGEWQKGNRHGRGLYVNAAAEKKVGFWANDTLKYWEESDADATVAQ